MVRTTAVLAVLVIAACGRSPELRHPEDPSTDFYEVSPGIYRGGRLDQAGIGRLANLGIKTIINLEDDDEEIAAERTWATAAAIRQISSPMSGQWTPDDRQIDKLLATLADPARRPVYVHCMKGMDRTGIVIALHRVYNEGWTPAAALRERDSLGFNNWLVLLDRYYQRKARRAVSSRLVRAGSAAASSRGYAAP